MLATENDHFGIVVDNSYLGKAALNHSTDWSSFIDGSYDDAQVCETFPFQVGLLTYLLLVSNFSGVFWLFGELLITKLPEARITHRIWSACACERSISRP